MTWVFSWDSLNATPKWSEDESMAKINVTSFGRALVRCKTEVNCTYNCRVSWRMIKQTYKQTYDTKEDVAWFNLLMNWTKENKCGEIYNSSAFYYLSQHCNQKAPCSLTRWERSRRRSPDKHTHTHTTTVNQGILRRYPSTSFRLNTSLFLLRYENTIK